MKRQILWILWFVSLSMCAEQNASEKACASAQYKQFDFWVGDWEVFDPKGKKVGENRVIKVLGGCAIQEHWVSVGRSRGYSYNIYDQGRKVWHQTWVDNGGLLLRLDGGLNTAGGMVLEGEGFDPHGKELLNRITWTPDDGNVRQLWQISSDQGKNWQVVFEGIYRNKASQ